MDEDQSKLATIKLMAMLGPVSPIHIFTVIDGPEKTIEAMKKDSPSSIIAEGELISFCGIISS